MIDAQERLKLARMRPTVSRIAILNLFSDDATKRLSVESIYESVARLDQEMGIASVYRVTREMEERGVLVKEWTRNGKIAYSLKADVPRKASLRFVCRNCEESVMVDDSSLRTRLEKIAGESGMTLDRQTLTVEVDCARCSGTSVSLAKRELRPRLRQ